jgi:hypothetical protein
LTSKTPPDASVLAEAASRGGRAMAGS